MSRKRTLYWLSALVVAVAICGTVFFVHRHHNALPTVYNFNDTVRTKIEIVVPDSVSSLGYFINYDYNAVDSIEVVDGVAVAEISTPAFAFVNFFADRDVVAAVVADGKKVWYDAAGDEVRGSALNRLFFDERMEERKLFLDPMDALYEEYFSIAEEDVVARAAVEKKIDAIDKQYAAYINRLAANNSDNIIPAYALANVFYNFSYEQLAALLDSATAYAEHPILAQAKSHLEGLYKRRNGIAFSELNMQDTEGNKVSLSQWAGQGYYVFVDFWASWCAPCRGELPNILAVYEKYHDKAGFDVVGVSVDQDRAAWVGCIDRFKLPWHHMSELKGRGGQTQEAYGVGAIPCSVLLDPEGKIVASDLRGDQLMNKMAEIYGF